MKLKNTEKMKIDIQEFEDFCKRNYSRMHFALMKIAIDAYKKKLKIDSVHQNMQKEWARVKGDEEQQ